MRHASWIRGLLAAFAAASFGIGCSTAPDETAPQDQPKAETPADAPKADMPPQDPGKIEAENEEWRRIAEEAAKSRTVNQQEKHAESTAHYDRALEFEKRGDFDRAKQSAMKALEAWPSNLEARKLLNRMNDLLSGGGAQGSATEQERLRNEIKVQIERAQLEITSLIREGERYRAVADYDNALQRFEEAEFKIRSIPYILKAMKDLLPRVEEYIRRTREAGLEAQRQREENQRALAVIEAAAYEQARKREVLETIAHLLEQAYMAFDQRRFDKTIKLCDEITSIGGQATPTFENATLRILDEILDDGRIDPRVWSKQPL